VSYPLFFARFPATRDVPWASWLLFVAGLAMLIVGLRRAFGQPERYKGKVAGPIFGVLSLALVGLFLFLTVVASKQLPPPSSRVVKVGGQAPDFTLPDPQGQPVRLYDVLGGAAGRSGSWALLIFYRGYW
jgi:cytochrome oxidase Cu insertion factor (SCO1/SenC/PrrC family)